MTWTVTNTGNLTATGDWSDQIYLSTQATLTSGATLLLTQDDGPQSPLPVGGSYTQTAEVTLPLSAGSTPGANYLFVKVNGSRGLLEASETNNVASAPITLALPQQPDLVVNNIVVPASGLAGQGFNVSWNDENNGAAAATGTWVDNVYVSTDQKAADGTLLGQFPFSGSLAAGQSATMAQHFTYPGTPGQYFIIVTTDDDGGILEVPAPTDNTTVSATSIDVQATPLPDLVVSSITPPVDGVLSGTSVPITFIVTNQGTGPTPVPVWYDYAFISQDPNLTFNGVSDQIINNVVVLQEGVQPEAAPNPSYLAPGQSYQQTIDVAIPLTAQGTWYAYAVANGLGHHFAHQAAFVESNGENNRLTVSGGFTVTLSPPPVLTVSGIQANAEDFSGQPMNVSWTVTNTGSGRHRRQQLDRRGLPLPRSVLDSNATLLGTFPHSGALAAGGSYQIAQTVDLPLALNGQLYGGPFYLLVQTDKAGQVFQNGDTTGNVGDLPITVNLTPPPDLSTSLTSVPATALASHALTFSYQVANTGAGPTPNNSWTDAYYFSPTATFNANTAILLGQQTHFGSLGPGVSYDKAATETLPNGLSGTYYLFVQADSAGAVIELPGDVQNKLSPSAAVEVSSQPADLIVSAASAPPTGVAGTSVTVHWTVTNQGSGDTVVTSWTDAVYANTGDTLDASAVLLDSFTHTGLLNAGGSYSQSRAVPLPQDLLGSYNLFVVTNADGAVYEGSNSGNNASAPMPISIVQELPDLVVSAASAPAAALSGSAVLVNWTVTNQGTGGTGTTSWLDNVYADTGTTVDANAVLLGSFTNAEALAAGGSYSQSQLVTLPITMSGATTCWWSPTSRPGQTRPVPWTRAITPTTPRPRSRSPSPKICPTWW